MKKRRFTLMIGAAMAGQAALRAQTTDRAYRIGILRLGIVVPRSLLLRADEVIE